MDHFQHHENKIKKIIESHSINRVIIGYSGGADSQFLLYCLKNINVEKIAVHINHGISNHSEQWESFCKENALANNITFKSSHLKFKNVQNNVEEKARLERYRIFKEHSNENTLLLTGHHMDDQAETVLMRIFRGTGLDGLEGIPEISKQGELTIYRPLLDIDKDHIKKTLTECEIPWVEDESNVKNDYDRNFVRNEIIPLIKKRWSAAPKNISKLSDICKKENKITNEKTNNNLQKTLVDNEKLCLKKLKTFSQNDMEKIIRAFMKHNGQMALTQKKMDSVLKQIVYSNSNGKVMFKNFSLNKHNNYLYYVNNIGKAKKATKNFNFETIKIDDLDKKSSMLLNGVNKKVLKVIQEFKIEPWLKSEIDIAILKGDIIGIGNVVKSDDCPFEGRLFS